MAPGGLLALQFARSKGAKDVSFISATIWSLYPAQVFERRNQESPDGRLG
jgi:hypothetical protein